MDAAIRTKPVPFPMPNFTPFMFLAATTSPAQRAPTPTSPLVSALELSPLNAFTLEARIRMPAAKAIMPAAPLVNRPPSLERMAATNVNSAITPPSATTLPSSLSESMDEITFSAPESTSTAAETATIPPAKTLSFRLCTFFVRWAITAITPSSSPNVTVSAPIAAPSRSAFTMERTAKEPAIRANALAIVIKVSAFLADFHASTASPRDSMDSLISPTMPFALEPMDLMLSRNPLMETNILAPMPPRINWFSFSGSNSLNASFAPSAN